MGILDFIFPKNCLNCGKVGSYICKSCLEKIPKAKNICFYCRKASIDGMTHTKCAKKLGLERYVCPWIYAGVVRKATIRLKYRFSYDVASELVNNYISKAKEYDLPFPKKAIIVPVPLHLAREKWRGFNQSEILGRGISKKLGYKFIPDLLLRRKKSVPQAQLKGEERKKNIRGAFAFNEFYKDFDKTTEIFVFDDVATTGSTLKEAVKVLKRKNFKRVSIMTIPRT